MTQFSRSSLLRTPHSGESETFWTGQIWNNFGTGSCSGSGTSTGFDISLPIKSCPFKAILYLNRIRLRNEPFRNHSLLLANNSAKSPQNYVAWVFMPTWRGKGREDQQVRRPVRREKENQLEKEGDMTNSENGD
jgi:hypothetical protein